MGFTGKAALFTLAAAGTALGVAAAVRKKRRYDLAGRVVIVTGGSRGHGLELARQLADRGARLAVCGRDAGDLAEAARELEARGAEVLAEPCDVTLEADVKRFVAQVRERFGRVDVLVNNAGTILVGPAERMRAEDYAHALATNFAGPLAMMLEVVPEMVRRGSGRVLNVASVGGLMPIPHLAAYCASKHALVGLSQGLRADLARRGVYVSVLCPGVMATGSPRAALFKGDAEAEYQWFASTANTPGLAGDPADVAAAGVGLIVTGDAFRVSPWQAAVQPTLHALAPGVGAELAALFERLLPEGRGPARPAVRGAHVAAELPEPLAENQREAAVRFNQV